MFDMCSLRIIDVHKIGIQATVTMMTTTLHLSYDNLGDQVPDTLKKSVI